MPFEIVNIETPDLQQRAFTRSLLQFRQSPVFLSVLYALMAEVQVFVAALTETMIARMPATASNEQLDAIGRIVGQLRTLIDFDTIAWFAPDKPYQTVDTTPAWVTNAPLSGSVIATDSWMRQLIEAKVSRNFVKYGSIPELKEVIKQAFGVDIGFNRTDIMTVEIIVQDNTSFNLVSLLEKYVDSPTSEHAYFLPLAAGVRVSSVVRLSDFISS